MPTTRFSCTLCGHDQGEHNLIVGCPHCNCMATPGEASRNGRYEGRILPPGEYLHEWQRPEPPKPAAPEPQVRYEVWRTRPDGTLVNQVGADSLAHPVRAVLEGEAERFNAEEAENARTERREVRMKFVVVKAVTRREVLT